MARHPAIQHQNRMREIADVICRANLEAAEAHRAIRELEARLLAKRVEFEKFEAAAKRLESFAARILREVREHGIHWVVGLPKAVTIVEYEREVAEIDISENERQAWGCPRPDRASGAQKEKL